MFRRSCQFASLILLATCTGTPDVPDAPAVAMPDADSAWTLDTVVDGLSQSSCPAGTDYKAPVPITISAKPVDLGPADEVASRLPAGVSFVAGWELTADNKSFGGLSDLALDDDGDLLAVADDGAFVWIGLEDGVPDGTGKLAYMRGADGNLLQGKSLGDAEGLAVRNGLAIVSFERTHRISAFNLDDCGAAAGEASISPLPDTYAGRLIDENRGAEALTVTPEGHILFGYETVEKGHSPIGAVANLQEAGWTDEVAPNPAGYAFVGFDTARIGGADETFWLFRSYDPIRGNRNVLSWQHGEKKVVLTRPLAVDNYEGITVENLEKDVARVWIISDDNFNPQQRTLLLAFDIAVTSE
ncbi:esterase-like activity of phytase family protein [Hyphomonas adhaerens]|uniref:esterase-like activity of phytase family protein n=1 Tax=Hyphomonas adhaerens TaxID=81029 RepID=UPI00247FBEBA|nr:esterase-like activity of phytase family protein [Hyphomonas adhaerens]|tara:strand:+ start:818 stop:1888 length:1071 start_codon:yes stop_codon:yes gene_type:complete